MRKLFAIAILAIGFWLGIKTEGFLQKDRCLDAGGTIGTGAVCIGAKIP